MLAGPMNWRSAWAAVAAVGLRPCSGALIVLTFALLNGLVAGGVLSVFAMAVGTALVFILPTGGRAIIAVPPYLIIAYEMTILFGVLFTLVGFFIVSRLPAWRDRPYTPESNIDRFVVVVEGAADADVVRAEKIFREAGAEETRRVGDGQ